MVPASNLCFKLGPILTKELTFSSNIGQHDLDTKNKQIQQWIEKKYQVQITIKKGKNADEPENKTVSGNRYASCLCFLGKLKSKTVTRTSAI